MPGNRNVLFLIIGALIVAVGVLGYNLYQTKTEPEGLQIHVGPERTEDPEQVKQAAAPIMKNPDIKSFSFFAAWWASAARAGNIGDGGSGIP